MNEQEFTDYITPQLEVEGISFNRSDDLDGYGGWFDSDEKELAIWTKGHLYFMTLVHEYCHFLQWRDDFDFWNSCQEPLSNLFSWLNKDIESTPDELYHYQKGSVKLERDCELKSIQIINDLHIDIDIDHYSRAANVYLFCYNFILQNRCWPKQTIYDPSLLATIGSDMFPVDHYLNVNNLSADQKTIFNSKFL